MNSLGVKTYRPFAIGNRSMFGAQNMGQKLYPWTQANRTHLLNSNSDQIRHQQGLTPYEPTGLYKTNR